MKLSSKTMSSPGRTEKFPPPLMRFLRSNVGSRSRGRSRSSPMFVRKKNTAIETQEPSSPKVTCIGQVRVRRSKQSSGKAAKARKKTRGWCRWIRNALCCKHFVGRLKPKPFRPVWRKWVLFFRVGFRRKSEIREDSSRIESKLEDRDEESEQSDDVGNEEARVFYSSSFSPPKNALLLTRCRSAPYRSSSLASRFWGSPLATEEEKKTEPENTDQHNPASENEPSSRDSAAESRTDPETDRDSEYLNQSDDSTSERSTKPTKTEAFKTGEEATARPFILTRCKSEPARSGARLNPDTTLFWKKRRPSNTKLCALPLPCHRLIGERREKKIHQHSLDLYALCHKLILDCHVTAFKSRISRLLDPKSKAIFVQKPMKVKVTTMIKQLSGPPEKQSIEQL